MTDERPKRKYTRRKRPEAEAVPAVPEDSGRGEPGIPAGATEITWERPSGFTLTTNASQDTIDYARASGWKVVEAK